jgi:squalene-hopene/tetraprenyl-beta-curcumene cyclase
MNYIYGSWSALCALNALGLPQEHDAIVRAAAWLKKIQNMDGGWGEAGESYRIDYSGHTPTQSTPSQSAWALLGLMAAGEINSESVSRGIDYLKHSLGDDGLWSEERFTATGFPRVFYLRYHGYPQYFPLWALARYRHFRQSSATRTQWGM